MFYEATSFSELEADPLHFKSNIDKVIFKWLP